jgi:hypothetical protein
MIQFDGLGQRKGKSAGLVSGDSHDAFRISGASGETIAPAPRARSLELAGCRFLLAQETMATVGALLAS